MRPDQLFEQPINVVNIDTEPNRSERQRLPEWNASSEYSEGDWKRLIAFVQGYTVLDSRNEERFITVAAMAVRLGLKPEQLFSEESLQIFLNHFKSYPPINQFIKESRIDFLKERFDVHDIVPALNVTSDQQPYVAVEERLVDLRTKPHPGTEYLQGLVLLKRLNPHWLCPEEDWHRAAKYVDEDLRLARKTPEVDSREWLDKITTYRWLSVTTELRLLHEIDPTRPLSITSSDWNTVVQLEEQLRQEPNPETQDVVKVLRLGDELRALSSAKISGADTEQESAPLPEVPTF